jgi:hypothetical protein
MPTKRTILAVGAVLSMVAGSQNYAYADATAKDMQVVARALGFLEKPPTGTVEIGIVVNPAQAESAKEGESLRTLLGDGFQAGKIVLKPRLVPVADIGSASGLAALFVTHGMGAQTDAIAAVAKANHLVTVTTDDACVQSGKCVLSIKTEPALEIVVSKAAAEAAGVTFATSFRVLIKEI